MQREPHATPPPPAAVSRSRRGARVRERRSRRLRPLITRAVGRRHLVRRELLGRIVAADVIRFRCTEREL